MKMTPNDLSRATRLIHTRAGIVLGDHKEEMVARNLSASARRLRLERVSDYLDYLEQNARAPEWDLFVTVFTINHTAFLREPHHFKILADFVAARSKPISVWSSACSTGEEPYSIAITLRESIAVPDSGVKLLATDVDSVAVERARHGMYPMERVQPIPQELLKKHFQRGTGASEGMVRVRANVKNMVEFGEANLISGDGWEQGRKFDVIFCRNVMIYFDKPTQEQVLSRFARVMNKGGLLFVGHSENYASLTKDFRLLGQTVYERV